MKPALFLTCAFFALFAFGCGEHEHDAEDSHDHDSDHQHEDSASEARYDAETGLTFSPHALEALQPKTTVARPHALSASRTLRGRIFATTPNLLASTHVPASEIHALRAADFSPARLQSIDQSESAGTGLVGLVIALAPSTEARIGDFVDVTIQLPAAGGLLVPRESVLTTASGNFVYVQNGEAWQRVPVTFTPDGDDALITSGVAAGATVLVSPTTDFWLTELRLTKGGGHSH